MMERIIGFVPSHKPSQVLEPFHALEIYWFNFVCSILQLLANQWNRSWGDVC